MADQPFQPTPDPRPQPSKQSFRDPFDPAPDTPPQPDATPPHLQPDPGGPISRPLAIIIAFLSVALVITLQNIPVLQPPTPPGPAAVEPGSLGSPFELTSRVTVKTFAALPDDQSSPFGSELIADQIRETAATPAERVRAAIVLAEIADAEAALEQLNNAQNFLDQYRNAAGARQLEDRDFEPAPTEGLEADIRTLRALYESDQPLDDDASQRLIDRHGFIGRVAAAFNEPPDGPDRTAIAQDGLALAVVINIVALGAILALIAGFGLFITALILLALRKIKFRMPTPKPGGSVMLEVLAVFALGFAALNILGWWAQQQNPTSASAAGLGLVFFLAQWLLILSAAWPLLRGMSIRRLNGAIGLHSGRGLFREIIAGVVGYLAILPLFLAGIFTTLAAVTIYTIATAGTGDEEILAQGAQPFENPVFDLVSGGAIATAILFLMATVWAPLCEELVFRGAFYRHLRYRIPIPFAAFLCALTFGLFHNYGPLLVWPVVGLGFGFALIREWRGSLIACFTAHAIHNAAVITTLVTIISLLN